jgi:hypothetical protein
MRCLRDLECSIQVVLKLLDVCDSLQKYPIGARNVWFLSIANILDVNFGPYLS